MNYITNDFILSNDQEYLSINLDKDLNLSTNDGDSLCIYLKVNTKKESVLKINIKENSTLKLIMHTEGDSPLNAIFDVEEGSTLILYSSVLFKASNISNFIINLKSINSSFTGYEYISANNNKITGDYRVNHLSKDTTSNTKLMYLSKNDGFIDRQVVSNIEKGMDNSVTSENIKGIILDKNSRIDAKPILIVSNDDVVASHGCAIGTVDDNEIYYLMSRGLNREDALKIICRSLINPILKEVKNDEFYSYLEKELTNSLGE